MAFPLRLLAVNLLASAMSLNLGCSRSSDASNSLNESSELPSALSVAPSEGSLVRPSFEDQNCVDGYHVGNSLLPVQLVNIIMIYDQNIRKVTAKFTLKNESDHPVHVTMATNACDVGGMSISTGRSIVGIPNVFRASGTPALYPWTAPGFGTPNSLSGEAMDYLPGETKNFALTFTTLTGELPQTFNCSVAQNDATTNRSNLSKCYAGRVVPPIGTSRPDEHAVTSASPLNY